MPILALWLPGASPAQTYSDDPYSILTKTFFLFSSANLNYVAFRLDEVTEEVIGHAVETRGAYTEVSDPLSSEGLTRKHLLLVVPLDYAYRAAIV